MFIHLVIKKLSLRIQWNQAIQGVTAHHGLMIHDRAIIGQLIKITIDTRSSPTGQLSRLAWLYLGEIWRWDSCTFCLHGQILLI